jgi:hypothetical protein
MAAQAPADTPAGVISDTDIAIASALFNPQVTDQSKIRKDLLEQFIREQQAKATPAAASVLQGPQEPQGLPPLGAPVPRNLLPNIPEHAASVGHPEPSSTMQGPLMSTHGINAAPGMQVSPPQRQAEPYSFASIAASTPLTQQQQQHVSDAYDAGHEVGMGRRLSPSLSQRVMDDMHARQRPQAQAGPPHPTSSSPMHGSMFGHHFAQPHNASAAASATAAAPASATKRSPGFFERTVMSQLAAQSDMQAPSSTTTFTANMVTQGMHGMQRPQHPNVLQPQTQATSPPAMHPFGGPFAGTSPPSSPAFSPPQPDPSQQYQQQPQHASASQFGYQQPPQGPPQGLPQGPNASPGAQAPPVGFQQSGFQSGPAGFQFGNIPPQHRYSEDDPVVRTRKQIALLDLEKLRLQKKVLTRNFTMDDPLSEMLVEIEGHESNDNMVTMTTNILEFAKMVPYGIVMVNQKIKLLKVNEEWAEDFTKQENMVKMQSPIEKIYKRFLKRASMNPFLEIAMILVTSLVVWDLKCRFVGSGKERRKQTAPAEPDLEEPPIDMQQQDQETFEADMAADANEMEDAEEQDTNVPHADGSNRAAVDMPEPPSDVDFVDPQPNGGLAAFYSMGRPSPMAQAAA